MLVFFLLLDSMKICLKKDNELGKDQILGLGFKHEIVGFFKIQPHVSEDTGLRSS